GARLADRIQAGALAVTVALERFDPGRGTRLTTYLAPVVARALCRLGRQTSRRALVAGHGRTVPWAPSAAPGDGSGPVHGRGRRPITLVALDTWAEDVPRSLAERLRDPASPTPEERTILSVDGAHARAELARLPAPAPEVL